MKVVDAGVVVEMLVGGLDPDRLGDEELAAPHLIDTEVLSALRGLARRESLSVEAAGAAVAGFAGLVLSRFPADRRRGRIWALRDNLSAYDATYVALAETLDATALLTTDARLAAAPGVGCPVELLDRE